MKIKIKNIKIIRIVRNMLGMARLSLFVVAVRRLLKKGPQKHQTGSTPRARKLSLFGSQKEAGNSEQGTVSGTAPLSSPLLAFRSFPLILILIASTLLPLAAAFLPTNDITTRIPFTPQSVSAAPADTLNFQGRLLNTTGSLIPDGLYNMQFDLYNVSTGGSSLWTEDRLVTNTQAVSVTNGYYSVYLGEYDALPSIDWSQELYLGMTVRGTANCAWGSCTPADAEMTPRFKLTAVPFAFSAANVASGDTNAGSTDSSGITIQTGDALGATSNSGELTVDVGTATGTTGAISLGSSNASALTLGNATATFSLNSTALDISTTGVISGATGITSSGTITFSAFDCTGFANGGVLTTNGSGQLECQNDDGGGAAPTLQSAYNNGNTILAVDASDIDITLPDTATDPNFTIDIATGAGGKFAVQNNGTDAFRVDSSGIDLIDVDVADFTGAVVTFDADEITDAEVSNTLTASNLVGTGSTSNAVDLATAEVAGTLTVNRGGTGIASYTTGDFVYASGATTLSKLAAVASGSCLISQGVGVAPVWGSCTAGGGITSINGETGAAQTLAIGSAGTDFNLVTTTNTQTFNIPTAGTGITRGLVTNAAQTLAGIKTFSALANLDGGIAVDGTNFTVNGTTGAVATSGGLTVSAGGAAITGNSTVATGAGNTLGIGNATGALTVTGSSLSNFILNGVTVSSTEFNRLDGKDAALVDTNDAVATAITGTGALSAGSITSGFGSIDNGASAITTTGTLTGGVINAATGFRVSGAASAGTYLRGNGTNFVGSSLLASDLSGDVTLGTQTSGNYVANVAAGTGLAVTGATGEGWAPAVAIDYTATLAGNPALSANIATFASTGLIFEGSTANTFETLLTAANPTADRTITLPNASGTVAVSASGNIILSAAGNITLTGQVPVANGGTGATTLNNLITLGTHTTGNYLATLDGNSQVSVTGSGSESAAVSLAVVADSIGDTQLAFNTGQHLTTTSTPTFGALTLNGNLSLGTNTISGTTALIDFTNFDVDGSGNVQADGTLWVVPDADDANQFLVEDQAGNNLFRIDATADQAVLGESDTLIPLIFNDGTSNTITITPAAHGQNTVLTVPDSTNATDTFCLFTLANCSGTASDLQGTYDAGSAGDQIIALDATNDSLIFRNPASSGSSSTYILTLDQLSTGTEGGLSIESAGSGNLLRVRDTTATAKDVFTVGNGGLTTIEKAGGAAGIVLQVNDEGGTSAAYLTTTDSASANNTLVVDGRGTFSNGSNSVEINYAGNGTIRVNDNWYGQNYWQGHTSSANAYEYTFFPRDYTGSASGTDYASVKVDTQFAPTGGANTYSGLAVGTETIINQTGGASGATRGVYINPTLTAAADFRALEIANTSGIGIYQSSTSITSVLAGDLRIGSTTAPTVALDVTGSGLFTGDLGVNGADITTTATGTATVFNSNATDIDAFGAATTIDIGAADGLTRIRSDQLLVGFNGAVQITGSGTAGLSVSTDLQAGAGITSGNALFESGDVLGAGAANSGSVTLRSGTSVNGTSGVLSLATGNVSAGTGNSGNLTVDTGSSFGGTTGTLTVAATNASALTLGRAGLTTANAGALTVTELLTSNGGLTIDAVSGSTGDDVYFSDASFTTCTALETVAGILTCGTDDGGSGNTLQGAYDAGSVGDQIIALNATNDSLIVRNPAASGSNSGSAVLTVDQLNTGAVKGLVVNSAGTANFFEVQDTGTSVFRIANNGDVVIEPLADSSTAVQILDGAGNTAFNFETDSSAGGDVFRIGTGSRKAEFEISESADYNDDLFIRLEGSDGTSDFVFTDEGTFGVNRGPSDGPTATVDALVKTASYVGLRVQGAASQTANLVLVEDDGGDDLVVVNSSGNVGIGVAAPVGKLDVLGTTLLTSEASSVISGTADPDGTQFLPGSGTSFTTELNVGDRITVNGETRTVVSITNDTNLIVDINFTNTAAAAITRLPATLYALDNSGNASIIASNGLLGVGTAPSTVLHVSGAANDFTSLQNGIATIDGNLQTTGEIQSGLTVIPEITPGSASSGIFSGIVARPITSSSNLGGAIIDGVRSQPEFQGSGNLFQLSGLTSQIWNYSSGTVTSAYGLKIDDLSGTTGVNSGTFTNTYGLYVGDISSGTQTNQAYGLYVSDVNAGNYLAGGLTIGDADTTGMLLTVDTKTDSGDPTGTNGAIYYNSNAGKFRCYEAGSWVDCIGAGGSGGSLFSDASGFTYLTQTADDLVIGGTSISNGDIILGDNGETVFNEQGNNADFRIEGDTNESLVVVDGVGRIGFGADPSSNTFFDIDGDPVDTSGGTIVNIQGTATSSTATSQDALSVIFDVTPGAAIGGSPSFNGIDLDIDSESANFSTGSSITAYSSNNDYYPLSVDTLGDLTGFSSVNEVGGSGTVTDTIGAYLQTRAYDSGVITNAYGLQVVSSSETGSGSITNNYGISISAQSAPTNNVGLIIGALSGSGNNASLVLGQTSIPGGDWGIYNSSDDDNYLEGDTGIGVTSTPAVKLHVHDTIDGNIFRLEDNDGTCDYNPESGSVTVSCSSDRRLKTNIVDAGDSLDYLNGFRIRNYDVISSGTNMNGVIAQEALLTHPELVTMGSDGLYKVSEVNSWTLIEALQEVDGKINDLAVDAAVFEGALDANTTAIQTNAGEIGILETNLDNGMFQFVAVTAAIELEVAANSDDIQTNTGKITTLETTLDNGMFPVVAVSGSTVTNTLEVVNYAEIAQLTVTADAGILGDLMVRGATTVQDLKVNGKIISVGDLPIVTNGTVLGLDDTTDVSGNDIAGTVSLITDVASTPLAGETIVVEFDEAYVLAPRIALTPTNADSAQVRVYAEVTATGFILHTLDDLTADTTYTFDYIIIQ